MIALDRGLALVSFVLLPIVMVLTVVFRIISRKNISNCTHKAYRYQYIFI